MVNRLLHPQEVEVFYILPTLRKHFAICLKDKGLMQKQIAELLDVEGATVSQYVNEKRANKIKFENNVLEKIKESTERITDKLSLLRETQHLLKFIRQSNALCTIHRQLSHLPETCTPSSIGCNVGGELSGIHH
ncbi:MAG: hypothetical protein HY363_00125 [Candidatus Aenigmarchaeota archaeon]|nr:hypothetical protein [Candidatus Aenigmarchaeota archaeon]